MRLVLMQFLSPDGVSQGPGGPEEATSDDFVQGGWLVPHVDDGFLFGRRTYEAFAQHRPGVAEPDPFAAKLNGLPKYVASQTLTRVHWSPTTILSGVAAGPIDELRLAIAPVVVGSGRRLSPDGGAPAGARLVRHHATATGIAVHLYEPTGLPEYGTYSRA